MDVQQIEILGRQRLIEELIRSGIEVAMPIRDRGTDLVAYIDRYGDATENELFAAVPIQMKSAVDRRFSLHSKYARLPGLLLVYVWHVRPGVPSVFFAMTYSEAFSIAQAQGWTRTESWKKGHYSATRPSPSLVECLKPFQMTTESWKSKIMRVARGAK